jgi:hypothetical protein
MEHPRNRPANNANKRLSGPMAGHSANQAPSQVSSQTSSQTSSRKEIIDVDEHVKNTLVILDVNGILVKKNNKHDHGGGWKTGANGHKNGNNNNKRHGPELIETKGAIFEVRDGARVFIQACFENYQVAIWTSGTYTNANPVIEALFTADQKKDLVFRWFRDHTKYDPEYGTNPEIHDYDTIKPLEDIYQCAQFVRKWTAKNVLIIDDTYLKHRFNNQNNCVIVPSEGFINYTNVLTTIAEKIALIATNASSNESSAAIVAEAMDDRC